MTGRDGSRSGRASADAIGTRGQNPGMEQRHNGRITGVQVGRVDGASGTLQITVWPAGDPLAVVVVQHGQDESVEAFADLGRRLSRDGVELRGADWLGDADSALVPATLVADLDRVIGEARAAHPTVPVVLLGHGLGATVALRHAQVHPERLAGLVLAAPLLSDATALDERGSLGLRELLAELRRGPGIAVPTRWLHGDEGELARADDVREPLRDLVPGELHEHVIAGAGDDVLHDEGAQALLEDFVQRLVPGMGGPT